MVSLVHAVVFVVAAVVVVIVGLHAVGVKSVKRTLDSPFDFLTYLVLTCSKVHSQMLLVGNRPYLDG